MRGPDLCFKAEGGGVGEALKRVAGSSAAAWGGMLGSGCWGNAWQGCAGQGGCCGFVP